MLCFERSRTHERMDLLNEIIRKQTTRRRITILTRTYARLKKVFCLPAITCGHAVVVHGPSRPRIFFHVSGRH